MELQVIKGNLVNMAEAGTVDAIGHGCNAFHVMGSGIAPKINAFTDGSALAADKSTPYGDANKLGTFSVTQVAAANQDVRVYNLYTQHMFALRRMRQEGEPDPVYVHWKSVEDAIIGMIRDMRGIKSNFNIALPMIGCGLAGGQVEDFKQAVTNALDVTNHIEGTMWLIEYSGR